MTSTSHTGSQEPKPHPFLKGLAFLFESIFPSILILKVWSYVRLGAFSEHPWIAKQSSRCRSLSILLLIPSCLSIFGAKLILDNADVSTRLIQRPIQLVRKKQFKQAKLEFGAAYRALPLKRTAEEMALCFLIPTLISLAIRRTNTILSGTRKLEKILITRGWATNGKLGVAVYLPIGVIVDVTGQDPRNIVNDDAIWNSLNMDIDKKDWLQKPNARSVMMFKQAFTLPSVMMYDLQHLKEE